MDYSQIDDILMGTTNLIISKNPQKFQQITSNLVKIDHLLDSYKSKLDDPSNDENEYSEKTLLTYQEKYDRLKQSFASFPKPLEANEITENDGLGNDELLLMQDSIIKTQDDHLDSLLHLIGKQKVLSEMMNDELEVHINLLDNVNERMDQTGDRMQVARNRMERFIEDNNPIGNSNLSRILADGDFSYYFNCCDFNIMHLHKLYKFVY
jgi:hypothetical protein